MQAPPFESDPPHGALRAIARRDPVDAEPELIELARGIASTYPGEPPFRFVRSEGREFPSHRCLIPASECHVRNGGVGIVSSERTEIDSSLRVFGGPGLADIPRRSLF
jgi:hypothetical protein